MDAKIVVVTGAAGYLGTELVQQLLNAGYTVRATVRNAAASSAAHLKSLADSRPGKLSLIEADLLVEGAFDKAVDGATFLFHTASPATFGSGDPERDQKEIVDVAVLGTLSVLRSAAKSTSVKRVVLTSSIAAINSTGDKPVSGSLFTANDWNKTSTVTNNPYRASKTQAEQAAWKLAKELKLDLVTINPSMIVGPVIATRGGASVDSVKVLLEGGSFETFFSRIHIDIRDVADAHIRAAEIPTSNGRYILANPTTNWKAISDALRAEFPTIAIAGAAEAPANPVYDTSKAENELGMRFIPPARSFKDQARTLLALGYVKPAVRK